MSGTGMIALGSAMTQDSESQPGAIDAARAESRASIPGLWPAAVMALLSGVAFGFWLMSSTVADSSRTGIQASSSELRQVDQQDIDGALTTMSGSEEFLARFRQRKDGCPAPLAWVSVAETPGDPSGKLRLQSGDYVSPLVTTSGTPVRVAIPYPAPFETGHGVLGVMDAGAGVTVALVPPWRIPARSDAAAREVFWNPGLGCVRGNG